MKICFWGDVSQALLGKTKGGGELQIALLAKVLAKAGHQVYIFDYNIDEGFENEDGIKVLPLKGWNKGIRYIRFFTHRIPSLYVALRNLNADIYYCRIRDFRHIVAYWAAYKVNAKFVMGLASDLDVMSLRMRLRHYYLSNIGRIWWLFNGILTEFLQPILIRNADYILVQHEQQKKILAEKGIKSDVFPNLIDLSEFPVITDRVRKDFVYVGSLDKRKGFVEFIEIVKKTPLSKYKIVGQPRDKTGNDLFEILKTFSNVTLAGRLEHSRTLVEIANAKALISTSPVEGFPNTFLEAWAYGVPVLSLHVDPGKLIQTEGLGYFANGDINNMIKVIKNNVFNDIESDYVNVNHAINPVKIAKIDSFFNNILKGESIPFN